MRRKNWWVVMERIVRVAVLFLCVTLLLPSDPVGAQPRQMAPLAPAAGGMIKKVIPPDIAVEFATIDWANSRVTIVVARNGELPANFKMTRVFTDIWGPVIRKRPIESPGPGEAVVTTGGPDTFQYHKHGEQDVRFDNRITYTIHETFSPGINSIHEVTISLWDVTGGNPANDKLTLRGGDRPPRPAAVPDYITSAVAAPAGDKLRATIRVTNPRNETLRNLRLILVKGHLALHEWKPIGLGPHASASVHWDVTMPDPGATVNFEAILTTDLESPLPPADTILDRQSFSYRRGTTIIGTP